jgi:hypothetical protein
MPTVQQQCGCSSTASTFVYIDRMHGASKGYPAVGAVHGGFCTTLQSCSSRWFCRSKGPPSIPMGPAVTPLSVCWLLLSLLPLLSAATAAVCCCCCLLLLHQVGQQCCFWRCGWPAAAVAPDWGQVRCQVHSAG